MVYKYKFSLALFEDVNPSERKAWLFETKVLDFQNPVIPIISQGIGRVYGEYIDLGGTLSFNLSSIKNLREYTHVYLGVGRRIKRERFEEELVRYREGFRKLSGCELEKDAEIKLINGTRVID